MLLFMHVVIMNKITSWALLLFLKFISVVFRLQRLLWLKTAESLDENTAKRKTVSFVTVVRVT